MDEKIIVPHPSSFPGAPAVSAVKNWRKRQPNLVLYANKLGGKTRS